MPANKKALRAVAQELKDARKRHRELLRKVEKGRAKLERRTDKLHAFEAKIAHLETRAQNPHAGRLGQAAVPEDNLTHARLIYNPKSGANKGISLEDVITCLRKHGIVAEISVKTSGRAARELAKDAADRGEDLVIVAAGDGTIEEVASQLVGCKTALGIVPIGTMNNLARSLGVPLELDASCALLGMGVTRKIDIGRVIANEKPQVEFFLETAGAGLSAVALPAGQAALKGRWSDLVAAVGRVFHFQQLRVTVELDSGEKIEGHSHVITVSNAPLMGKNLLVAPDAKMDDGMLDVGIYENMSKGDLLTYFMSAVDGKRPEHPNVKFYRSCSVRIWSEEPLEVHSDKDVIEGTRTLEIEVVPGALTMIVGNGIGLSLPVEAFPEVLPLTGPQNDGNDQAKGGEGRDKSTPIDEPRTEG